MKSVLPGAAVAGVLLVSSPVAEGCGDANVSLLSAMRSQLAFFAANQATVVVLKNQRASGEALANRRLHSTLKDAGNKVQVVENAAELSAALKARKVDVVLADSDDARLISPEVASISNRPTIIPVFYKPSNTDWKAVKKQNPLALKAPGDAIDLLTKLRHVMEARLKLKGA